MLKPLRYRAAVAPKTLDGALERGDFGFELGDAVEELVFARRGRGVRLAECQADLVGAAPLDARGYHFFPLWNLQLDDVRKGDRL